MLRKSQISVEYLMIIGFATLMTIPLVLIYLTYSVDTKDSVAVNQAMQISRMIADASESVFYLGKPSQTTLKLNFPSNIESVSLTNREVLFKIKTKSGVSDIAGVSNVNMSGSLPTSPGIHIVTLRAEEGYVDISSN